MNPAYSVILFSVASGAGFGLLGLLGLVGFNHGQASSVAFALAAVVAALALTTLGLVSSLFHLGHPERAWRALSQWRSSWLSREGIAALVTYPVALAFGLAWSGLIDAPHLVAPLGIALLVMSVLTIVCTGKIYSTLKTIRAWNTALTVPVYLAFAFATGASILGVIALVFGRFQVAQAVICAIALGTTAVLKWVYWAAVDGAPRTLTMAQATGLGKEPGEWVRQWEEPHTATNFVQKEMGFVVARKHARKLRTMVVAVLAAAVLAAVSSIVFNELFIILTVPLSLFAAVTERWLFFAEAEHVANLYYGAERR